MRENNQIICNQCGKHIRIEREMIMEGCLSIQNEWGYFSRKDGEIHQIDLCEDCYDMWIAQFQVPIEVATKTELI